MDYLNITTHKLKAKWRFAMVTSDILIQNGIIHRARFGEHFAIFMPWFPKTGSHSGGIPCISS
jgi:hypothetical protein